MMIIPNIGGNPGRIFTLSFNLSGLRSNAIICSLNDNVITLFSNLNVSVFIYGLKELSSVFFSIVGLTVNLAHESIP